MRPPRGAHTGDIAAEMIADAGGTLVIVGHSERRSRPWRDRRHGPGQGGSRLARRAHVILCIGETEAQRKAGETLDVIDTQLSGSLPEGATAANLVIAYEPVWAIGTGLTPSNDDIQAVHSHIKARLAALPGAAMVDARVLYGGSVKPGNAAEILGLPGVDGALVGGASLKAADFLGIVAGAKNG